MDESRTLAGFLAGLGYDDFDENTKTHAKNHILDQLGVEIAASTKPASAAAYEYAKRLSSPPEATIVNYGDRVAAESAAFANATFGHGFELDDTYFPGTIHPGCVVVPSALAIGERERLGGKEFLTSVITGYEAMGRIARTMAPHCVNRGFHPTAVTGPFGAAAAVGKFLGFDESLMLNSISIASSHSSGLTEFDQTGGSVKQVHAGIAASGGIRAALLARAGVTGPPTPLEGRKGVWHAFVDSYHPEKLTSDSGKGFVVTQTSYKRYACCHQLHTALDVVSKIVKEHALLPGNIDEIVMGTNRTALVVVGAIREPEDVTQCQFSAAFTIAMIVVKGTAGFDDYCEANVRDPQVRSMARKVRLELDDWCDASFPAKRAVKITVKTKDGSTFREKLGGPIGTPENPISADEIEAKFRRLAGVVFSEERVEDIIAAVRNIESLEDVSELSRLLVRKGECRD